MTDDVTGVGTDDVTGVGTDRTIGSRLRRAFGLVILFTVVLAGSGVAMLSVVVSNQDVVVDHLEPLRADNVRALVDMTNAETGIRGYLLTGNRSFLQPYWEGLAAYSKAYGGSVRSHGSNPVTEMLIRRSESAAGAWFHGYAAGIATGPGGLSASSIANDDRGKALFDAYRASNQSVSVAIHRLLDQRIRRLAVTVDVAAGVLVVLALLVTGGVAVVGIRVDRSLSNPLDAVRRTIIDLANGDPNARAPVKGPLEIQAVANSINRLADEADRTRQASEERNRMSRLAPQISRRIRNELEDEAVLDQAVVNLGTALHADRVLIRSIDDGQAILLAAQWAAEGTDPLAGAARLAIDINMSADAWSDLSGTLVLEDVASTPLPESGTRSYLESMGMASLVRQMLWDDDELMGTVLITAKTPRTWTEGELDLVRTVAGDLARALGHARLFRQQQELVTQLRELDEAKTSFVATVSHELRTPLTSIAGYVELMQDGDAGPTTPAQDRMLETVARNTVRLRALVDDLLTLSRIESGTLGSSRGQVVLGDLVRSIEAVIRPLADQGSIRLRVEPGEPTAWVWGDSVQLERALLNLASNAVKFTPPGGEVSIRVALEGTDVLLVVDDTGIGIPVEEQNAVFEQFHRASNAISGVISGTGLGLAITRAIVEQHCGTLRLTSVVGVGTTVILRLPQDARTTGARSEHRLTPSTHVISKRL